MTPALLIFRGSRGEAQSGKRSTIFAYLHHDSWGIIRLLCDSARKLLNAQWSLVEQIATALIGHSTLPRNDLITISQGGECDVRRSAIGTGRAEVTARSEPALRQAAEDYADRIADLLIAAKDDIPLRIDPVTQRDPLIAVVRSDHIANSWVVTILGKVIASMIMAPADNELLYLVTDAHHRRAGAGRMLIDQAKQIAT